MLRCTGALGLAAMLALTGCRPAPSEPAAAPTTPPPQPPGPAYVVGEQCLNMHLQPAHLFPHFLRRDAGWTADVGAVRAPLAEAVQRFAVLGFDGARRGTFVTANDRAAADPEGFVGTYSMRERGGVCGSVAADGSRVSQMSCVYAGGCGLAIAVVATTSPPPEAIDITIASTCVADGALIADLDRDGIDEAFPLEAFLDRAEIPGSPYTGPACTPRFTWYGTKVGPDIIDVLGAGDFDRDGRLELVIAIRSGGSRTVAMYGTRKDSTRLARLAVVSR